MLKEGRVLVPSSLGRVLSTFLKAYFEKYVDYGFTASLEVKVLAETLTASRGMVLRYPMPLSGRPSWTASQPEARAGSRCLKAFGIRSASTSTPRWT